jgi:hypothetical protein
VSERNLRGGLSGLADHWRSAVGGVVAARSGAG